MESPLSDIDSIQVSQISQNDPELQLQGENNQDVIQYQIKTILPFLKDKSTISYKEYSDLKRHEQIFGIIPNKNSREFIEKRITILSNKIEQNVQIKNEIFKLQIQLQKIPEKVTKLDRIENSHEFYDKLQILKFQKEQEKVKTVNQTRPIFRSNWTIRQDTRSFKIWTLIKVVVNLITTFIYPYYSVNGFPQRWTYYFYQLCALEVVFMIDIVSKFFLQELDEKNQSKNLPLEIIGHKYLSSQFLLDFIIFLPLGGLLSMIDSRLKFFWLIKAIRIIELKQFLSPRYLNQIITFYMDIRQGNSLNDPVKKFEINEDLIYIEEKIYLRNFVKICRLILIIVFVVYFVGQYWIILVQISSSGDYQDHFDRELLNYQNSFSFLKNDQWDLTDFNGRESTLVSMYFALTSLSTIGFGDLYPQTDAERLIIAFMILIGVAMFSYILGELRYMVQSIHQCDKEFEHKEKLEQFFMILEKFNYGSHIDYELQNRISKFFERKWDRDKNNFLTTESDKYLLDQLPQECQNNLYTEFLFKSFLWKFRRLFHFNILHKNLIFQKIKKGPRGILIPNKPSQIKYPYYTYEDTNYGLFMKKIMNMLEIRFFKKNEIIVEEMDESLEVLFVEKGIYEVGFEINNRKFFESQFGMSTNIGGFQICFKKRHSFIYRARTQLDCLAIRRQKFMQILEQFPEFRWQLRQKMFTHFSQFIYQPLIKKKAHFIKYFRQRQDYQQILSLTSRSQDIVKECILINLFQMKDTHHDKGKKQMYINSRIQRIHKKLDTVIQKYSLRVFSNTERVMRLFNERLIKALCRNKINEEFVKFMHNLTTPFRLQLNACLYDMESFEKVEFDQKVMKLRKSLFGENRYEKITRKKAFNFEVGSSGSSFVTKRTSPLKKLETIKQNAKISMSGSLQIKKSPSLNISCDSIISSSSSNSSSKSAQLLYNAEQSPSPPNTENRIISQQVFRTAPKQVTNLIKIRKSTLNDIPLTKYAQMDKKLMYEQSPQDSDLGEAVSFANMQQESVDKIAPYLEYGDVDYNKSNNGEDHLIAPSSSSNIVEDSILNQTREEEQILNIYEEIKEQIQAKEEQKVEQIEEEEKLVLQITKEKPSLSPKRVSFEQDEELIDENKILYKGQIMISKSNMDSIKNLFDNSKGNKIATTNTNKFIKTLKPM